MYKTVSLYHLYPTMSVQYHEGDAIQVALMAMVRAFLVNDKECFSFLFSSYLCLMFLYNFALIYLSKIMKRSYLLLILPILFSVLSAVFLVYSCVCPSYV